MSVPPQEQKATPLHDRRLSMVLAVLALGLLAAFWMVCSHQVRKAQIRDISLAVQRVAVADCLRYVPRATLNSCVNRVEPGRREPAAAVAAGDKPVAAPVASRATMSSGAPVNVAF